jgi:hypothetical protein
VNPFKTIFLFTSVAACTAIDLGFPKIKNRGGVQQLSAYALIIQSFGEGHDIIWWTRLANFPDLSGSSDKTLRPQPRSSTNLDILQGLRFKDSASLIHKSGYFAHNCASSVYGQSKRTLFLSFSFSFPFFLLKDVMFVLMDVMALDGPAGLVLHMEIVCRCVQLSQFSPS